MRVVRGFTECSVCDAAAWPRANAPLCKSCYRSLLDHGRESLTVNGDAKARSEQTWSAAQRRKRHEVTA
jgi:hypothetical protein